MQSTVLEQERFDLCLLSAAFRNLWLVIAGFSLRILVAGERCNVTGEYFERGSTSEYKIVIGYRTFAGESCIVNGEFSDRRSQMNTL